jgi:hypothetical protein
MARSPFAEQDVRMKVVGRRVEPQLVEHASGALLAQGALFSESIARLSQAPYIPKGVYRFRSHEAAHQHEQDCLVRAMAKLALERRNG